MIQWLQLDTLLHIPVIEWARAGAVALAAYAALRAALAWLARRLTALAGRTTTRFDDALAAILAGTSQWLLLLVALLAGANLLDLPPRINARLPQAWFLVITVQAGLWLNRGVGLWTRQRIASARALENTAPYNPVMTVMLAWMTRSMIWSVAALAMLSNFGVDITAFVASLGVGGVAVALAVQNILSDLFASLAIGLDKPFEIGDFIVFGPVAGTVEHVGLKTTRIRSLGGEQIICSNTDLLKNTIHNYRRMQERRVVFGFTLGYETPTERLCEVPQAVREIVAQVARARFERAHFKSLGESGLFFEVVYHVTDPDYGVYMDVQQAINLGLVARLARMRVRFAVPARHLFLSHSAPAAAPAGTLTTLAPA